MSQHTTPRISQGNLQIAEPLYRLVADEVLPDLDISSEDFWSAFESIGVGECFLSANTDNN